MGHPSDGPFAAPPQRRQLLQLRVFRFGLLEDGDVWVGVFPEGKEILSSASFLRIAGEGVGTG
jgi:hypothetical protein